MKFPHILSPVVLAVLYLFTPMESQHGKIEIYINLGSLRQIRISLILQIILEMISQRMKTLCGIQYAGKSGLVIRNRYSGVRRVMVAKLDFCDTDQVYHLSTSPQNQIGTIIERFPTWMSLVQIEEQIEHHNGTYFDASTGKEILVTSQYAGVKRQVWFFLDSPFTGLTPSLWAGFWVGDQR
jgi:hypothetical protein